MSKEKPLKINWILGRASLSGGVKSNRLIAEAMVRRGHNVNIYYVDLPKKRLPVWRIRSIIKYLFNELRSAGKERHHLRDSTANLRPIRHIPIKHTDVSDADVTIATWWQTAHWIKDWPQTKGRKAYFVRHHELHGGDESKVIETYFFPFKKLVIASWLKDLMSTEYGDNNTTLVPNGVDWSQFGYIPRGRQVTPTIGMLYGAAEWKGAVTAFEAIKRVQSSVPTLRVICFGSQHIGKVRNLPTNLHFLYRPSQAEIPGIYRSVDCWLVPSTTEGFGMPGLEAVACGCPIVSTRCGGPEDYIDEGDNGYLVNVGDAEDMALKILKIMQLDENDWKVMSNNSAKVAKRFDWDASAEILETTLKGMLA